MLEQSQRPLIFVAHSLGGLVCAQVEYTRISFGTGAKIYVRLYSKPATASKATIKPSRKPADVSPS